MVMCVPCSAFWLGMRGMRVGGECLPQAAGSTRPVGCSYWVPPPSRRSRDEHQEATGGTRRAAVCCKQAVAAPGQALGEVSR